MTENDNGLPADFLEWDSAFFGKRIARVKGNSLKPDLVRQINAWSAEHHIDCLYFLATINDDETTACAEADGYHFVDLRVTLSIDLNRYAKVEAQNSQVRLATETDVDALRQIASINHTNSRFFTDNHFDRGKCRQLYEIWIEKAVKGQTDRVFVWEERGKAAAYVTATMEPDRSGSIGLVGISPDYQGRGIGKIVLGEALDYFAQQRAVSVTTATQGRNIHALKLYQRCGFSIQSIQLWYHKWFN